MFSPENMGMAADELLFEDLGYISDIESPFFGLDLGMQKNLEEQISKLLFNGLGIPIVQGRSELIRFFQKVGDKGAVGLGLVPGAALRAAELGNDLHKFTQGLGCFLVHCG
jgi:hypothetical protein